MLRTALTLSLTVAIYTLTFQTACADVYEYRDEKGNKLYTDKPRTLPAQRLDIKTQKTDTVAVEARQEADMRRMQDAERARRQSDAARTDQRQANQISAKDQAERCVKARERYDGYVNARRLYETGPNNERRFLSEQEIAVARDAAKTSMDTLCK